MHTGRLNVLDPLSLANQIKAQAHIEIALTKKAPSCRALAEVETQFKCLDLPVVALAPCAKAFLG